MAKKAASKKTAKKVAKKAASKKADPKVNETKAAEVKVAKKRASKKAPSYKTSASKAARFANANAKKFEKAGKKGKKRAPLSASDFTAAIAEKVSATVGGDWSKREIRDVLNAQKAVVGENLCVGTPVRVPGVAVLRAVLRPAKANAKVYNPFKKTTTIKDVPAKIRVRVRAIGQGAAVRRGDC